MMGALMSGGQAANPSAEALGAALALLRVASDPQATAARMSELTDQMEAVRAAHADAVAERKAAEDAQRALADLQRREQKLADDIAALNQAQTAAAVAAAALAAREQALGAREVAADKHEADLTRREQTLDKRVAGYREALGG